MTLEQVVILPHPPIVLPEIAGHRFNEVKITANGMIALSKDIMAANPELLVIITPHSTLHPNAFAIYIDEMISGNFAMFGAPNVKLKVKNDLSFLKTLQDTRALDGKNDIVHMRPNNQLDHGSGVPLYYILKEGYQGTAVIINYTYGSIEKHQNFGKSIAKAVEASGKKTVLIASGDLSHRITPSAPAGYHPDGEKFDAIIVDSINTGNYKNIISIDNTLRSNAGECAYNSLMVAFGALNGKKKNNKIYSYEAPFGVGYLVASL